MAKSYSPQIIVNVSKMHYRLSNFYLSSIWDNFPLDWKDETFILFEQLY